MNEKVKSFVKKNQSVIFFAGGMAVGMVIAGVVKKPGPILKFGKMAFSYDPSSQYNGLSIAEIKEVAVNSGATVLDAVAVIRDGRTESISFRKPV